jgi:hypothetical protein
MSDVKKFIEDMKDDNISIFGSMLKPLTRNNCETIIPMLKDHPDPRRRAVVVDMGKPNVIYLDKSFFVEPLLVEDSYAREYHEKKVKWHEELENKKIASEDNLALLEGEFKAFKVSSMRLNGIYTRASSSENVKIDMQAERTIGSFDPKLKKKREDLQARNNAIIREWINDFNIRGLIEAKTSIESGRGERKIANAAQLKESELKFDNRQKASQEAKQFVSNLRDTNRYNTRAKESDIARGIAEARLSDVEKTVESFRANETSTFQGNKTRIIAELAEHTRNTEEIERINNLEFRARPLDEFEIDRAIERNKLRKDNASRAIAENVQDYKEFERKIEANKIELKALKKEVEASEYDKVSSYTSQGTALLEKVDRDQLFDILKIVYLLNPNQDDLIPLIPEFLSKEKIIEALEDSAESLNEPIVPEYDAVAKEIFSHYGYDVPHRRNEIDLFVDKDFLSIVTFSYEGDNPYLEFKQPEATYRSLRLHKEANGNFKEWVETQHPEGFEGLDDQDKLEIVERYYYEVTQLDNIKQLPEFAMKRLVGGVEAAIFAYAVFLGNLGNHPFRHYNRESMRRGCSFGKLQPMFLNFPIKTHYKEHCTVRMGIFQKAQNHSYNLIFEGTEEERAAHNEEYGVIEDLIAFINTNYQEMKTAPTRLGTDYLRKFVENRLSEEDTEKIKENLIIGSRIADKAARIHIKKLNDFLGEKFDNIIALKKELSLNAPFEKNAEKMRLIAIGPADFDFTNERSVGNGY